MTPDHPTTLQDVAEAAGVHRTTVSLALRQSPKLPAATRERILDLARKLGYRPNPLISALMTARAKRARPAHRGTLAFVSIDEKPPQWDRMPFSYGWMFQGAVARADERGYRLEPFWVNPRGLTRQTFARMAAARNIHGLLIAPHHLADNLLELDWSRFSVVELGYNLAAPVFHRVVHDYYHSMRTACRKAVERGFQRIGFVLNVRADLKSHHLMTAACLHFQQALPQAARLAIHMPERVTSENLRAWIRAERPDVMILGGHHYPPALPSSFTVPARLPVISLDCLERHGTNTGIFQDWPAMGATAVDLLSSLLERGDYGVPIQPQSLLVGGIWRE